MSESRLSDQIWWTINSWKTGLNFRKMRKWKLMFLRVSPLIPKAEHDSGRPWKPNHFPNFWGLPPLPQNGQVKMLSFFWISYILKIKAPLLFLGFSEAHHRSPLYRRSSCHKLKLAAPWPSPTWSPIYHHSWKPHPDRVRHLYTTTTTSNSIESTTTLWPPKQVWHLQRRAFLRGE